jgi:membrane protein DedA with SNARE-associated domain
MSNIGNTPTGEPEGGPPPPLPPPQRSGCLTAFMVIAGVILLLPGLCAIIFSGMMVSEGHAESGIVQFVVVGLTAGVFGVVLIWTAFRRPGPD